MGDILYNLQKVLITDVYPEMVRLMKVLNIGSVIIAGTNGFNTRRLYSNGELYAIGDEAYVEELDENGHQIQMPADITSLGNICKSKICPTYYLAVNLEEDYSDYDEYCEQVIKTAETLKEKFYNINKLIDRGMNIPIYSTRKILFEKII